MGYITRVPEFNPIHSRSEITRFSPTEHIKTNLPRRAAVGARQRGGRALRVLGALDDGPRAGAVPQAVGAGAGAAAARAAARARGAPVAAAPRQNALARAQRLVASLCGLDVRPFTV